MSRLLAIVLVATSIVTNLAWPHEPEGHQVDPRAIGAVMPRISPSGDWIAFSYQGAIWRMAREGGEMTRLTHGAGFDIEPAWSSDEKLIALINSPSFGAGVLTVVDAESGKKMALPQELIAMDKVYFDRTNRRVLGMFQPANEKVRLAWFDLQSGELTNAVPPGSWPGHPPETPGIMRPRFALSHDNTSLAVTATDDEPNEQSGNRGPRCGLWRVPLSGGKPEVIVRWPARIHDVCWRADDRALFIATERGGVHQDLWEVPLENGDVAARKLTFAQADEGNPSVTADGKWLLYTDNHFGSTAMTLRYLSNGQERIVSPTHRNFGSPTGWLRLQVVEGKSPTTARTVIRHADGKFHAPSGALYRVLGTDMHFYLHEQERIELPPGQYSISAARGPEHRVARQTVEIRAGETTEATLNVERWTNQRAEGWVSGENHIHANYGYGHWYNSPASMWLQCTGEDLVVANFMVANSDGDGVFDREFFLGRPDPLSTAQTILYWNEEFRSTIWGHMTLLNLKYLVSPIFTGFEHTTHPLDVPTNAEIADHTHEQDGLVNYTHPAHSLQDPYAGAYSAKEMPIDVALGKVDSMDVMGSNHQANLPIWYRMLNCGLHVPASAGTDCFLNRIVSRLPGSDRVYVHCSQQASYQEWIKQLRAGHTFVTNGPMLRFTVNGQESGTVLQLGQAGGVRVIGEAKAQFPLEKLEVIVNGQVAATVIADQDRLRIVLDQELPIDRGSWVALRVRGPRAPSQLAAEAFAHTSAVYVEVAGHSARSPEDAEYFIAWIQRLMEDVRQRNRIPAGRQTQVADQFARAMEFYRGMAKPRN